MPRWFSVPLLIPAAVLLVFGQLVYPWAPLVLGSFLLFSLIVFRYPLAGICIWLVLYPVQSGKFSLHGYGLSSVEVLGVPIYPIEIMNVILMLVLVAKQLDQRQAAWNRSAVRPEGTFRWLLYLTVLFTALTVFVTLFSDNVRSSAFGGWRVVGNFFAVAFMVLYLKRFNQFVRVLLFYCVVASGCALLAIASTYYAFLNEYPLVTAADYGLFGQLALFNRNGQYFAPVSGMITGVGLSGKHELAMLMTAGTCFLVFLATRYRSTWMRFLFVLMLILFASVYQQAFSKTSIAGGVLVLGMTMLLVAPWKKWLVAVLLVYLAWNLVGVAGVSVLKPQHQKNQEAVSSQLKKTSARSKFQTSTYAQRIYVWGKTAAIIQRSKGLGNGPDSLARDREFMSIHGHNLFLNLAAEYGIPATTLFGAALLLIFSLSYKTVFASPRVRDPVWLLQLTLIVTTLLALLEYQIDLFVYYPHLWVMIGLLLAALRNLPDAAAAGEEVRELRTS